MLNLAHISFILNFFSSDFYRLHWNQGAYIKGSASKVFKGLSKTTAIMLFNNTESLFFPNIFLPIASLKFAGSSQGTNLRVRVAHDKSTLKFP